MANCRAVLLVSLIVAAGCGTSASKSGAQLPDTPDATTAADAPASASIVPSTAPPTTAPPTVVATTPSVAAPALSGFGATDAEWNATHTDDLTAKVRGVAYDHDPTFGGGVSDKYLEVQHENGRVLAYTLNFHHGTSLATAQREAAAELPADAATVWSATKDGCQQTEMTSKTLGLALADPAIGDPTGEVNIEFATGLGYDPNNVTEAYFSTGNYPSPADGPDC